MTIYVYGLYDPIAPERIRYVGATSDFATRVQTHARGNDRATIRLWDELRKLGRPICGRVLEETDELNRASVEGKWIDRYPAADLFNVRREPQFEFRVSPISSMDDMCLRYAQWTVERFGGNKAAAAKALAIGRQTLYNILRKAES